MTTNQRQKHVVNAEGKALGRVATEVTNLLRGKHKTNWVADKDMGDAVEVLNVDKMVYTGNKMQTKVYRHHTGRPGGLKEETLGSELRKSKHGPVWVLRHAVLGMLPTNSFRKEAMKRLTFRKS